MQKILFLLYMLVSTSTFAQVYPFVDDFESYTNFATLGTQGGYKSDMSVYGTHGMGNSPKGLVSQISSFNTRDTLVSPLIGQVGAAARMTFYYRIVNQSLYPSTATAIGTGDVIEIYAGIEAIGIYQLMHVINNQNHVVDTAFKKITLGIPGTFVGQTGNFKFVIKKGTATDYWVDIDSLKFADSTTIQVPITLNTDSTNALCANECSGSVGVTATGGSGSFSYVWSNSLGSSAIIQNVCAGTYTVTVTDGAQTTATASVNVGQPAALSFNPIVKNISCHGLTDGCLELQVSGGTGAYDYIWSPSLAGDSICGLAAGTYDVTVLDLNNCSAATTLTIQEPDSLTASYTATNPSTFGNNDGSIVVVGSGGTGYITHSLNGGIFSTTSNFPALTAGCYQIITQDENSCTVGPDTICLTNPPSGVVDFQQASFKIFPNPAKDFVWVQNNSPDTGEISLYNMQGETVFSKPLSEFETRIDLSFLAQGVYTLRLKTRDTTIRKNIVLGQ